jgi:hypothetical protein
MNNIKRDLVESSSINTIYNAPNYVNGVINIIRLERGGEITKKRWEIWKACFRVESTLMIVMSDAGKIVIRLTEKALITVNKGKFLMQGKWLDNFEILIDYDGSM